MKLAPLPKVTQTERVIAALEDQRDSLNRLISELRATLTPYVGEVEPLIDPRTGEIFRTKRQSRGRKR